MRSLIGIVLILIFLSAMNTAHAKDCVILLHGLSRQSTSMNQLQQKLIEHDYVTVNTQYPSRKYEISTLSEMVLPPALGACDNRDTAFVTHSMGGILVRDYYARHLEKERPFAVVMLGPPNKGSEIIDQEYYEKLGAWWNGPAGKQLSAQPHSFVNSLPPVDYPTGIIAGNKSIEPYNSYILPGDDDGKVSVKSTGVEGMKDWIVIPTNHTFMMVNSSVIQQTVFFIEHRKFQK